jgi:predicted ArsR family transcriptional regulator
MTDKVRFTTDEAAKRLKIGKQWFRLCVKALKLQADEVQVTGKRGRPADLWSFEQVRTVEQFIKE